MDVKDVTALIIALAGVAGTVTAYTLSKRGQHNDERQQEAATKIQKRITAFDELESLNDRLSAQVRALLDQLDEANTKNDLRLSRQGRRCRETLEDMARALAALQSVTLDDEASRSADDAVAKAKRHVADDHPTDEPDL